MLTTLTALFFATSPPASPDTSAADTSARRRIVRQFEPILVEGGRFSDPASLETVYRVSNRALRRLPVDNLAQAIALHPGVVALGEELHVRGGRSAEVAHTIERVSLNEPWRGSPMEVPLLAVRSAELLTGGLDADHAGSLAGEIEVHTESPTEGPSGALRIVSDGGAGTGFRALLARAGLPVAKTGLGLVMAGEGRFDDAGLPDLRTHEGTGALGRALHWRHENHVLGWGKLAPVRAPQRASLQVLASRVVRSPYDPMFDFDGWVKYTSDFDGNPHGKPVATSDHRVDSTYFRYRAADHALMTEDRRLAAIASVALPGDMPQRLTLAWTGASMLTSVGLRRDPGYVFDDNRVVFGELDHAATDPFRAYFGDTPLYREAESARWTLRYDAVHRAGRHQLLRFGAGATHEWSRLWEFDDALPEVSGFDTVRTYSGWAPGVFAYAQQRFELGGLVWNAGLRVQSFTAGSRVPNAYELLYPGSAAPAGKTWWSWCPRLGFSYPVSVRDVFSLAYSREAQDPPRDALMESRRTGYDRHPFGNRGMSPATAVSWQMALKHVLDPAWSAQVGIFGRDFYDVPGARSWRDPVRRVYFLRYESADEGHADGLEVSLLRETAAGTRLEFAYTFMNAWGTQSSMDGWAYGRAVGARPDPLGNHPLDWSEEHALSFTGAFRPRPNLDLSWSARVASGLPWTPIHRTEVNEITIWPYPYENQSLVNSERLPWSENTNASLRWRPHRLGGVTVMLSVANCFDNRTPRRATLSGHPNPLMNTVFDEYSTYRTETGNGGGAFWTDTNGDGVREWVPVNDPRLNSPPRSIRIGIEAGL